MRKRSVHDAVLRAVEDAREELVAFTQALIRIPTVNPPGENYDACAQLLGDALAGDGFAIEYLTAVGRQEHSASFPRVNVVARRPGRHTNPALHLNGHIDVVPVGAGWTRDPFGGTVERGRVYGRGASDMKSGIAAARFASLAIARAGIELAGTLELSGTVDEETGGWAGAAFLAETGLLTRPRVDYVIIPEPFGVDRICVGHRGVYWFELTTRGRTAHGSMPFLGVNAIDHMGAVLHRVRTELSPALRLRRTAMPVVPDGARSATINVNSVEGGQVGFATQSPCVADRCTAVFDRRFLLEESVEEVRQELVALIAETWKDIPDLDCSLTDRLLVLPVRTPDGSPAISAAGGAIRTVLGRDATLVASPGTYDHKHVTGIGGIVDCVAYGPGRLELSHQPDEWCDIEELVKATQVLALTILSLIGPTELRLTP
ncbi:MAG: N-formyl-4-amino-5-aminomethyl-2-methylpyrimidine deformylase [Gemmatimonadaceae bacterium]|nr:N-formyl-4-amino-5-aminomethyl-2-methylpyrimidine deformylase [Gemmatimonadaceae bacterium]